MDDFKSILELFDISPQQLAGFLWRECLFSLPDQDCQYLESLTPSQLRAFAELILAEADIKEEVSADVA